MSPKKKTLPVSFPNPEEFPLFRVIAQEEAVRVCVPGDKVNSNVSPSADPRLASSPELLPSYQSQH